jgi:hypothetical protein
MLKVVKFLDHSCAVVKSFHLKFKCPFLIVNLATGLKKHFMQNINGMA